MEGLFTHINKFLKDKSLIQKKRMDTGIQKPQITPTLFMFI